MRKVKRSALVPYSAMEMFSLVDDIDAYAEFLPWCNHSVVLSRNDSIVDASLEVHKGALSKTFSTRNRNSPFEAIDISLIGGPFRHLAGGWQFESLGESGSKVMLDLEFQFDSRFVDAMFGSFFEETCNSLVDAFIDRAMSIYGNR
jgi:ribosome-associated toxin RatA of RatAB toxin-antitoxin module